TRGVGFEDILKAECIEILNHPKKDHQKILVYEYKDYIWAIPCVIDGEGIFLKTLYPSRKLTKRYLNKEA
ncbi:MAG: hypothetical protein ACI9Y8_001929, partial [Candidatus Omnitrophota bacterium]